MAMMNVLAELHQEQELKLNLKFEIEVLCKTLGLDVNELKPTTYLKDPTRMPSIEHQVCSAPHTDCWIGTLRVFLLDFSCPRSVFNGSQKKLHVPTSFFNSFCFFIFSASIQCRIHSLLLYYECIVFFISAGSLIFCHYFVQSQLSAPVPKEVLLPPDDIPPPTQPPPSLSLPFSISQVIILWEGNECTINIWCFFQFLIHDCCP